MIKETTRNITRLEYIFDNGPNIFDKINFKILLNFILFLETANFRDRLESVVVILLSIVRNK